MFVHNHFEELPVKQKNEDGQRYYVFDGRAYSYPSVTEVLKCRGKIGLNQWRQRVGEQEAKRVQRRSAGGGKAYHTMVEKYLLNESEEDIIADVRPYDHTRVRFREATQMLDRIEEIYGIEIPLVSDTLGLGGTADCVGLFDGKPSVIDHKTSAKPKKYEWIQKYFAQATFYAVALYEMYGFATEQLVILMSVEGQEDQVFIDKAQNHIDFLRKSIEMHHNGEYD